MERILLSLVLFFFINLEASAHFRPLARYFKLVPEHEAHTYSGVAAFRELNPLSIKALVWNIKKALMYDWETEFHEFGRDQDLYLIQEAYGSERFTTTLEKFSGVRWDLGTSFLYRLYGDTPTGNMIGSVAEPTYVKVEHTLDYEPIVATPKTTTYARYPLAGHPHELLVISVHGINITTLSTFKRHMAQAKNEIAKHQGPVLFAGDFNTRTNARMKHLMSMIKDLKFTPVNFKNGHMRMRFKFTPYYLDHSFVRGLDVKHAEVYGEARGSDHKPMVLELQVSRPKLLN